MTCSLELDSVSEENRIHFEEGRFSVEDKSGKYAQASLANLFLQAPFVLHATVGVPSSLGGIFVQEDDAVSFVAHVKLSVGHGVMTLATTDWLAFVEGDGILDGSMQFSGPIGAVNEALSYLLYFSKEEGLKEDLLTLEVKMTLPKGTTRGIESRRIPIRFDPSPSPVPENRPHEVTSSMLSGEHLDSATHLALLREGNLSLGRKEEAMKPQGDVVMTSFLSVMGDKEGASFQEGGVASLLEHASRGPGDRSDLGLNRLDTPSQRQGVRLFEQEKPMLRLESLSKEIRAYLEQQGWSFVQTKGKNIGYMGMHPRAPEMSLLIVEHETRVIFCNPLINSDLSLCQLGWDLLKRLPLKGRSFVGGFPSDGERIASLIAAHGGQYILRIAPTDEIYPPLVAFFKGSDTVEVASLRLFGGSSWSTLKVSKVVWGTQAPKWLSNWHIISALAKVERSQEVAGKNIYSFDYYALSDSSQTAASLLRLLDMLSSRGMADGEWFFSVN